MTRRKRDTSGSKKPQKPQADDAQELPEDWLVEDGAGAEEPEELSDDWLEEDEGGVAISTSPAQEQQFDLRFDIPLGEMEKAEVIPAVEPSLRAKAQAERGAVLGKHVVLTFGGQALVPSAIKELCAEIFAPLKPLSVTIQRGYNDELCYEGEAPQLGFDLDLGGDHARLQVDAAGLDADIATQLFGSEVEDRKGSLDGQTLHLRWQGEGRPDSDNLGELLRGAGVRKFVLELEGGEEKVLFDRDLEEAVQVEEADGGFAIKINTTVGIGVWGQALRELWPREAERLGGQQITVQFLPKAPPAEEVAHLLPLAARLKPLRLGTADGEMIWPTLLRVARKGKRMLIKMVPTPQHDPVSAAQREMRLIKIKDMELTFDWPEGGQPQPEIEALLRKGQPAQLHYTVGGGDKSLILPELVSCESGAEELLVRIDLGAAKPAELLGQIDRALAGAQAQGKPARIEVGGGGVVPRSMREALSSALGALGATRALLVEGDQSRYLFPALLDFEPVTGGKISVRVADEERPAAEVATGAQQEIAENFGDSKPTVELQPSKHDAALVSALLTCGVKELWVMQERPLKVFPTLFGEQREEDGVLVLSAQPEADPNALEAQLEHELPHILQELGPLGERRIELVWPGGSAGDALVQRALDLLMAASPAGLDLSDGAGGRTRIHPAPEPEPAAEVAAPATEEAPPAQASEAEEQPEVPEVPEADEELPVLEPEAEQAVANGEPVQVLGQRLAADPPMTMLGVDLELGETLRNQLEQRSKDLEGHRLLLVCRHHGREISPNIRNPQMVSLLSTLSPHVPALMLFRPARPAGLGRSYRPAHFEVCHSTLDDYPLSSRHRDPRG